MVSDAVISVLVALAGHPILALFAGMIAGGFAGVITGFLQTKLKVHPVLAGDYYNEWAVFN